MLLVCSCDKHNVLLAERSRVEAEIKRGLEELSLIDQKSLSLGMDISVAHVSLDMQSKEWTRKNSFIEQELAQMNKKCVEGEAAIKVLRSRLDAYKAKYIR